MEVLKLILTNVKENKKLFWSVLVVIVLMMIKRYYPTIYNQFINLVNNIMVRISEDLFVISFSLVIMFTLVILFRYSDTKFHKEFLNRDLIYETYKSEDKKPFQINILENSKFIPYNTSPYREITFINNSGQNIVRVTGAIEFFLAKVRIITVPFEIINLENGYGHKIIRQDMDQIWDEFNFIIYEAQNNEESYYVNKRFRGNIFFMIPTQIKEGKWFQTLIRKIIPHDLTWIEQKIYYPLISRVKWHFRIQTFYEKIPSKKTRINIRANITRILLSIPFIVVAAYFLIFILYRLILILYDVMNLLIVFLWSQFSAVFL